MQETRDKKNLTDSIIYFLLNNKIVVVMVLILVLVWGILVAPFDWPFFRELRTPVPVDAIPDIGENQQIVFTKWPGRSPQDIEDQVSYPLTVSLLGIAGVKSVRSFSMLGFSSIYIIFNEDIEFYWSRSRILEKLNSLSPGTLPDDANPVLGPDATALGQVFWYTLEGRDENGNPTGGWDLQELRSIQDFQVKYALMGVSGVSEVASIGGFVQEYQVDVDPNALRAYNITLEQVINAVRNTNRDVSAKTIEVNRVEYVIRGIGFVKNTNDIKKTVIKSNGDTPVFIENVAHVTLGPALRRGALDKQGAEAVGGVIVVRYGDNPMQVIQHVKEKISEIAPGLPQKILSDGTQSKVTIVPFYDRTGLIKETLGTLESALIQQILITIIVVILMIMHFKSSVLISGLLPIAVIMTFIFMKLFHVDANIVALSGIAIAIGTMVDMGIVVTENIVKHLDEKNNLSSLMKIYNATKEVSGAVFTAVMTTIISFLPIFTLEAAEGKLFKPLAFTKTFALAASLVVALFVIPPFAHLFFKNKSKKSVMGTLFYGLFVLVGIVVTVKTSIMGGLAILILALAGGIKPYLKIDNMIIDKYTNYGVIFIVLIFLTSSWLPLGNDKGILLNLVFVGLIVAMFIFFFTYFIKIYPGILKWALDNKMKFLTIPIIVLFWGLLVWQGFFTIFGWLPQPVLTFKPVSVFAHAFPGLGKEFMPPLDEGAYLFMPTTMPHASIGEVMDIMRKQDMSITSLPEVKSAVGKLGRVESPLDPAPVSMIETIIDYHNKFITDDNGKILKFKYDADSVGFAVDKDNIQVHANDGLPYMVKGIHLRDENGQLVPDRFGKPFRIWRRPLDTELNPGQKAWEGIQTPDDIWDAIVKAAEIPGVTSAPKLQPISARIVMLQSGMRAPMGIKVKGPTLETIEQFSLELEKLLKTIPVIRKETVQADRMVGKPYLEIEINREKIARYGIHIETVQNIIETAIGGKTISMTVEGRERYPIRVRYMRELRDNIEAIENVLVSSPSGEQIPLKQLANIQYRRGPQMIKSEDTFLTGYVIFDKIKDAAEVDVVEQAKSFIETKIKNGELVVPHGVSYMFAGQYQNQIRAQKRLALILPLSLFVIFMILYLKFRSIPVSLSIFSSIAVAWAGGFIFIWLHGQSWFLNIPLIGNSLRDIFNIHPINMSVAIWVGFLALFGIASDDGVIIASYLQQQNEKNKPGTVKGIRESAMQAGLKRVRPCMMTTATTVLALLPVLSSSGRGSDIMVPMAIPVFGGMLVVMISMFIVPVLYAWLEERNL